LRCAELTCAELVKGRDAERVLQHLASNDVAVPVGSLDPDCIHLPSIYVKRLILGAPYDKKIEFRTVREREAA